MAAPVKYVTRVRKAVSPPRPSCPRCAPRCWAWQQRWSKSKPKSGIPGVPQLASVKRLCARCAHHRGRRKILIICKAMERQSRGWKCRQERRGHCQPSPPSITVHALNPGFALEVRGERRRGRRGGATTTAEQRAGGGGTISLLVKVPHNVVAHPEDRATSGAAHLAAAGRRIASAGRACRRAQCTVTCSVGRKAQRHAAAQAL